jgi:hypothetical protein
MTNRQERIAQLEAEIVELQARLPKHSTPPAMLIQLEELEDELKTLKAQVRREED